LFILTKTWLRDSIPDAKVDLSGFTAVTAQGMWQKAKVEDSSFISTTVGVTPVMSP